MASFACPAAPAELTYQEYAEIFHFAREGEHHDLQFRWPKRSQFISPGKQNHFLVLL